MQQRSGFLIRSTCYPPAVTADVHSLGGDACFAHVSRGDACSARAEMHVSTFAKGVYKSQRFLFFKRLKSVASRLRWIMAFKVACAKKLEGLKH